jgi:hypothetical protein
MMAYWLRNNPNPKNLRYYFALNVQEDATQPLVAKILQDKGHVDLPVWPGLEVLKGSKEFDILLGEHCRSRRLSESSWANQVLGSKIGATITLMLLQYKSDLGIKHVTNITLFRDTLFGQKTRAEVETMFTITDVPPGNAEVEAVDGDKSVVYRAAPVERRGRDILRVHEFRTGRAAMVKV